MHIRAHPADPPTPVRAAVAIILRPDPHITLNRTETWGQNPYILIAQRHEHNIYGGYWEFPGGKIEPGERPTDAAIRESDEELGVRILPVTTFPQVIHIYEHAIVHLHPVVARLADDSPEPQPIDAQACRWTPLDRLPWERFLPGNVRLVTALARYLATPNDAPAQT